MKSLNNAKWILPGLCLFSASAYAADSDSDGIDDSIEFPSFSPAPNDLVVDTSVVSSSVTAVGGSINQQTGLGSSANISGAEFVDTQSGFGYFRINAWTGDQSASIGNDLIFGLKFPDLGTTLGSGFSTTSTRDVAFVSNSGQEMKLDVLWGVYQHRPSPQRLTTEFQYSIPIERATFSASETKFNAIMSDLAYIEVRSEIWAGIAGTEAILIPAGSYYNGAPDNDGDGTPDYQDTDSDGDGLLDSTEGSGDLDNDGAPNYIDEDSDSDNILDAVEGSGDNDTDGIGNFLDQDSDNDGISDLAEGAADQDNDGDANYLDLDSDNDSIADSVEGGGDADGDGLANNLDTDSDEDSIPDGDDPDADGDGISNTVEAFAVGTATNIVINGDFANGNSDFTTQYPNTLGQLDQGIAQPTGAYDVEEDPNSSTVNFSSFQDITGDEMLVVWTGPTIGETVWSQDLTVEPGMTYVFSVAVATALDTRNAALDVQVDGVSLGVPVLSGNVGDWIRYYATYTNDSSTSVTLSIKNAATNFLQRSFALDDISFAPYTTDTDGDGTANFFDLDSDGDTLLDSYEGTADFDGDGILNFLDLDSDGDGVPDEIDGTNDADGDGTAGYEDTDGNNDSIPDGAQGDGDFDNDGIPDREDTDNDNDGIADGIADDTDGDGLANSFETLTLDSDDDGTPNYLDLDSDNDGLSDAVEAYLDTDNDGTYDYIDYQPSFSCVGFAFESYDSNTQFALVDVGQGVFINIGQPSGLNYNAIAYNVNDNYVYALNRTNDDPELLRIGSDGSVAVVGLVSGLPRSYVAGTFGPNGLYWVSGGGRLFGIDVDTLSVVHNHSLSPNPSGTEIDLAYSYVEDKMFGSTTKGGFFEVDMTNGNTITKGNNGKVFGALISDFTGAVYGFDNKGTGAFRVNTSNGQVTWVASAPKTGINDGTICPTAILSIDTDGDGIDDETDTDDDNDGIPDIDEGCGYNPNGDADGDGIRNWTDTVNDLGAGDGSVTDYTDSTGDGIPDVFDIDSDGTPNHLDLDRDGDGMLDDEEAPGDADNDGLENSCDYDSDNDGTNDGDEGKGDEDNDGIEDYLDPNDDNDDDGDCIPNYIEGSGDADNDGTPNYLDLDSDNDCFLDSEEVDENCVPYDSDNDGILNPYDNDDDNDGILTCEDPCPMCNFDDNEIAYDVSANLDNYSVRPAIYSAARDIWNELRYELNCNTNGIPLEDEKRGFDELDFYLSEDSEVYITVLYDGGNHQNTISWYDAANPTNNWTPIWQKFATGPTAPLIQGSTASLGIIPSGTQLRFGLVMDGGQGGTERIYQDAYLNPGGFEHVASELNLSSVGDPLILAWEDETSPNRDNDFNDVIFMVQIVPKSDGTSLANIGNTAANTAIATHGFNIGQETTTELYQLPLTGDVTFELLSDTSSLDFSLAVFPFDSIDNINQSALPYRLISAEDSVVVLDDRNINDGSTVTFSPAAHGLEGKTVGLLIVPSNTVPNFLSNGHRYTPQGNATDGDTKRQPLYSLNTANPGGKDQFLTFTDGTSSLLMIEDLTRHDSGEGGTASDDSFDAVQIKITPALTEIQYHGGLYYQGSPDPTAAWDGDDGYEGDQRGDF